MNKCDLVGAIDLAKRCMLRLAALASWPHGRWHLTALGVVLGALTTRT